MANSEYKRRTSSSVVMSNWASGRLEPKVPDRRSLIYELLILSLLYDEVLVQDQVFVCSQKMAKWFASPSDDALLSELFDIGTLVILKRPVQAYPEDLREKAAKHPILARSDYIQKHAGVVEAQFRPSEKQTRFHLALEACLANRPSSHREGGSRNDTNPVDGFRVLLRYTLSNNNYRKWIISAFKGLTPQIADDFIAFVEDPRKALARISGVGLTPRYLDVGAGPEFDTSLAAQVASTYPLQSKQMVKLIHSLFCATFALREEARGLYGSSVREMPLILEDYPIPRLTDQNQKLSTVQTVIKTDVSLPEPSRGFGELVREIRESDAGRQLRRSIQELGEDTDFRSQQECWRAVSDVVASKSRRHRRFKLSTVVAELMGHATAAAVIEGLWRSTSRAPFSFEDLVGTGLHGLGAASVVLGGRYVNDLRSCYLERATMQKALEQALTHRVVEVRVPPIAVAPLNRLAPIEN